PPVDPSNRTIAPTGPHPQPPTQNPPPRPPPPRIVSYSLTRSTRGTQIPIARDEPPRLPSRGFLPWRFSDAGRPCARHPSLSGRHPKTFTLPDSCFGQPPALSTTAM